MAGVMLKAYVDYDDDYDNDRDRDRAPCAAGWREANPRLVGLRLSLANGSGHAGPGAGAGRRRGDDSGCRGGVEFL